MLSIIIPTLNEEKYLPILLSQIKKQNFSDYEIIVADAGSTDKTVEIAKSFGCKVVKGGLPAKGRNEGAKVAKGDIFLFMDADNIYLPDGFLEKLIFEFKRRNLGVASFPVYPAGNFVDKICYFLYNKFVEIFQNWIALATNCVLIKKEVFEKIGGFDEEIFIGEDHDLAMRASKISKFGFIKTEPVLTSARRYEVEGRFKTYGKYILAGFYMIFFGPVKKKIFEYRFNDLKKAKESLKSKYMEELPKAEFELEYPKLNPPKKENRYFLLIFIFLLGVFLGIFFENYVLPETQKIFSSLNLKTSQKFFQQQKKYKENFYIPKTSQEEAVIKVVKEASPAVVSVVITKDIPKLKVYYEEPFKEFEEFFGMPFEFKIPQFKEEGHEKREIGGGTAFFISEDGLLLTNAHVVLDKEAEYLVVTKDGKKYKSKVLARDPISDLAILKIEGGPFPVLKLGDSDKLEIGQTVIAIGNTLGEFRNTVSVGVISGLGRRVTASSGETIETVEDVIQTDAAINRGNSGGPLLNLEGEVIGVNFAMAVGAENVGFAIPINKAKRVLQIWQKYKKIIYPFLGIRYILIDDFVKEKMGLDVDYGVLIIGQEGESAIFPDSPAEKAGLRENDIILKFNGEKITKENPLSKIILKYNPGDKVVLEVKRGKEIKEIEVVLGERDVEKF